MVAALRPPPRPDRPARPIVEHIPAELRARPQWVCWRYVWRGEKWTKVPYNPATNQPASSTDPATWGTFAAAWTLYSLGNQQDGIGYVFAADDPYCGIDLDHCLDADGRPAPWAAEILAALDSYSEVTPSGTGLHILIQGTLPGSGHKRGNVEVYDRGRYFTMTGARWPATAPTIRAGAAALLALLGLYATVAPPERPAPTAPPALTPILSDSEIRQKAERAKNGPAFMALWRGDTSAYHSASEGHAALCAYLAFYTRDAGQIERLFNQSALADHPKWRYRANYRRLTIDGALALVTETYRQDGPHMADSTAHKPDLIPAESETPDPRPIIRADRPLPEVIPPLIAAFHAANGDAPTVFQLGRALVRVIDSHAGGTSIPIIDAFAVDSLRLEAGRVACLVRYKATLKRDVETNADREQLAALLSAPEWPFPVLEGISEVPIIRPDGTVHDTPGYDSATRQMYHPAPGVTVAPVPAHPTAEQQAAARALIVDELLGDFPFTSDAELAHAVAMLLLPFARPLIAGPTPIHLVESPTPGTGKSLLVKAALTPALGNRLEGGQDKRDDDEMRKWITTRLQAGAPALWMDNIKTGLDSATLANATTQEMWEDRLLGSNTAFRAPVRCVWVATANNPILSTEMARRVLRIRLDAGVDQPQFRTDFRHRDILAWGLANRAALIHAALVLVRAWVAAGRPPGGQTFGSYQHYADVLGGILSVAQIPGFLQNAKEVYEVSDTESARWRTLVAAWWDRYDSRPVLSKDLLQLAQQSEGFDYSGPGGAVQFGIDLAKQRDRIHGGYRVMRLAKKYHNAWQWSLVPPRLEEEPPDNTRVVGSTRVPIPTHEKTENASDDHDPHIPVYMGENTLSNPTTLVSVPPAHPCADCGETDWYPHTPERWRCHHCGSFPPSEDM